MAPSHRHRPHSSECGLTLVELLVIVAIIGIVSAIAITRVSRAKITANETSAVGTAKVIAAAQINFSTACGNGGFSPTLAHLGQAPPGGRDAFLGTDLAVDPMLKSGYRFQNAPGAGARAAMTDCFGQGAWSGFYVSAVPQGLDETGTKSFALNQGGQVWVRDGGAAPTEPFAAPAYVLK